MASTNISRANGTGSATNKFTLSMWVKRGITDSGRMFSATGGSGDVYFRFNAGGVIEWSGHGSNASSAGYFITNRVFRDYNAWYHFVVRFDSTQASASNRLRFYVNGVQEESFSSYTDVNQNATDNISLSSNTHYWGGAASTQYFDGLISHVHYTVGYDYGPDSFGSTDSTTGEWKITTTPSVTYGSNGYFILKDGNSLTDQSGNSNNFTVANGTLTNTEDNPSNVFCTFNGVNPYSGTLSNGNLKMSQTSFNYNVQGTLGMESGKYYWEYKIDGAYGEFGVCEQGKAGQSDPQGNIGFYFLYNNGNTTGYIWNNATAGSQSSEITISAFASGMIINVAYDADNKALYIGQNGTWLNSGDPTSGASTTGALVTNLYPRFGGTIVPFCGHGTSSTTANYEANFGNGYFGTTAISSEGTNASGNGKFEYDVPTGYTALSTKGLNL